MDASTIALSSSESRPMRARYTAGRSCLASFCTHWLTTTIALRLSGRISGLLSVMACCTEACFSTLLHDYPFQAANRLS